jgi:hypothetical protein
MPIVLARDIANGRICWSGDYLINSFDTKKSGSALIDLDKFPRVKRYFLSHHTELRKRYIVKESPSNWYRTIDPIHKGLLQKPKLLLPDVTKSHIIAFDKGRFYPHHNICYITNDSPEDLKVVAAFLMSSLSLNQIKNISIILRGGFVRWQAQNVKRIFLPKLTDLPSPLKQKLIKCYHKRDIQIIDSAVRQYN